MFASAPERVALAARLATAIRPTAPAASRSIPVAEPLRALLAGGALRRGSTLVVTGAPGRGATSLGLSLLAAASAAGHWCAAVGLDDPGVVAMAELGIDLRHLVVVPRPRGAWAVASAELLEGVDVVGPPARVAHTAARKLVARARDRAGVLVVLAEHRDEWPVPADTTLEVIAATWHVAGRLASRVAEVRAIGRGSTGRARNVALWLPDTHGALVAAC
jgi:hypothetical protein